MLRLAAEGLVVTVLVLAGWVQSLCLASRRDRGVEVKDLRGRKEEDDGKRESEREKKNRHHCYNNTSACSSNLQNCFIKAKALGHQAHDDVQYCSTSALLRCRLPPRTHRLHGLEWCCVHIDAAAVRSFGDGLEHLRLCGGGESRGGGRLLRGQRHGGLQQRRNICCQRD